MPDLLTAAQAGAALGISARRVRVLCAEGRIAGAHKIGRDWLLPEGFTVSPPPSVTRSKRATERAIAST